MQYIPHTAQNYTFSHGLRAGFVPFHIVGDHRKRITIQLRTNGFGDRLKVGRGIDTTCLFGGGHHGTHAQARQQLVRWLFFERPHLLHTRQRGIVVAFQKIELHDGRQVGALRGLVSDVVLGQNGFHIRPDFFGGLGKRQLVAHHCFQGLRDGVTKAGNVGLLFDANLVGRECGQRQSQGQCQHAGAKQVGKIGHANLRLG